MSLPHYFWLYQYLWIAPHCLLLVVAIVMLHKGSHKSFPIFFSYLLFEFLQFCLLYAVAEFHFKISTATYLKLDLFDRAGGAALHFGILHELFGEPLAHNRSMRRKIGRIMNWITLVLIVLAVVFIGALYSRIFGNRFPQAYIVIDALYAAQVCGLVLVFLWHRFLGLRMSPLSFGITVGMGLVVGIEPLMQAFATLMTKLAFRHVDFVSMGAYHVAVVLWLYYAHVRETIRPDAATVGPRLLEETAELGRIIHS